MVGLAIDNPFTERNIIKNTNEFFGRKDELRMIFTRLKGLQSTSIYGERKIGKSSLLYNVFHNIAEELGNEYKSAYIDLRDSDYHKACDFLKSVLLEFKCDPEVISEKNNYNKNLVSFSESIKNLRKKCKPILLIDEFDHIIRRPDEYNNDFLDTLKTLGSQGYISYVTASLRSLRELCIRSKLNSTFYSIFSEIHLKELKHDEATDFLSAGRKGVNFNKEDIKLIKETAGTHPLYLRIACDCVFANKGRKKSRNTLRKEIENQINFYNDKKVRIERGFWEFIKEAPKCICIIVEKILSLLRIFLLK